MSHWNYRVFREQHQNGEETYSFREVYYGFPDAEGGLGCTEEPSAPMCDTLEDLQQDLNHMQLALCKPTMELVDNVVREVK